MPLHRISHRPVPRQYGQGAGTLERAWVLRITLGLPRFPKPRLRDWRRCHSESTHEFTPSDVAMPADAAQVRSAGIPQPASSDQEGSRCHDRGDWPDGESLRERANGRTHLPLGSISPSSSLHHSSLSRGNRLTVATRRGGEEGRGEPFRARLWRRRDSASKRRKTKKHKAAADGCNYPGLSYAYFIYT